MAHINQQAMLQQSKKMLEFKTKQTHTHIQGPYFKDAPVVPKKQQL